jgi:two-component system response regulator YesN
VYKLLIVEDEVWEREGLTDFLNWSELDIEVVGTAANGIQGIKMAKEHLPDIIMTDIRMPVMDGLKLSEEVKRFLPDCRIIIITGYDDFKYAKDAIHIGVYDYLLKPVQKQQLLNALNRTITAIQRETQREEYVDSLKTQLTERAYKERERFLLSILRGNEQYQGLIDKNDFRYTFYSHRTAAVVVRVNVCPFSEGMITYAGQEHFKVFYKRIRDSVGDKGITAGNDVENGEIVICLPVKQKGRSEIEEVIHLIRRQDYGQNKPEYIIGVGSVSKDITGFVESYKHAQTAVRLLFFMKDTDILYYDDLNPPEKAQEGAVYEFLQSAPEYSKKILNAIVSSDSQKITSITDEMFDIICRNHVDKNLVCNFLADMINEISILLMSEGGSFNIGFDSGDDILEAFQSCIKLEQLKKWFNTLLINANRYFTKKRKNREEYIIYSVLNIIENEYMSDIGLEVIAYRLGISPNHLGSAFKKYVGKRFTEVLTEFRMKKAKEMLISGKDSIMNVAKKAGFISTSYFCTVFKKIHGISPMEYREKHDYGNEDKR